MLSKKKKPTNLSLLLGTAQWWSSKLLRRSSKVGSVFPSATGARKFNKQLVGFIFENSGKLKM